MSEIKKIEEEYDLKILKLLELVLQECRKLRKVTLKIEKKKYQKDFIRKICFVK